MLSRQRTKISDAFQKELAGLKTKALQRKQLLLDKRDKILIGELADELTDYEAQYHTAFTAVELIA